MAKGTSEHAVSVKNAITIGRRPEEIYQFWRDVTNLPLFITHLERVVETSPGRSHWTTELIDDRPIEWDAIIAEEVPNELIRWRTLEGDEVASEGSVRFSPAPGGRGTEVRVQLEYDPPGGSVGTAISKLFGKDPRQQLARNLHDLKQVLETGEVLLSDATITPKQRPARPLERVSDTQPLEAR
jgi:uncharacterized membrane protein